MKKIFILLLIIASCKPFHIVIDQPPQTSSRAVGWQDMNTKYNYNDSTKFKKLSEFEDGASVGNYKAGSDVVVLDSVTTDGTNIYFYTGATILTAVPGVGSAAWGSISGTLTNQVDLNTALGLKANLNSPGFTGTVTGITAAMVSAMSTSHAANVITATNISNWNTAYGWGNPAGLYAALIHVHAQSSITALADSLLARYTKTQTNTLLNLKANTTALAGYVPTSRTVNGHALTGNVSVTAADVSLGNVTNESKATMFTNPTFTGTVGGVSASMVGLGNVTNESKATMFTSPTFTGTVSLPTTTSIGNASSTEIGYLDGAASSIQNQINAKLTITDTTNMLSPYPLTTEVRDIINDSISLKLNIANGTTTGTLTTAALNVGGKDLSIDSISYVGTKYALWDGVDTVSPHINVVDQIDINDAIAGSHSGTGIYNVLDYGAVGDGITDDRDAIQDAIAAAGDSATIIIPHGTYKIINATGVGGTTVLQRADACADNTLYPLYISSNNVTLIIEGNLIETSLLGDLIKITGDNCKVIGRSGSLTGCGSFLDTNDGDTTTQWIPSLVKITGDYGEVSGLKLIDPPASGVSGIGTTGITITNNIIRGGKTSHGPGTFSMGIYFDDFSYYCNATKNIIEANALTGKVYTGIYSAGSHILISENLIKEAFMHTVYTYGNYINISDNVSNGTGMLAAHIQVFSNYVNISDNTLNGGISGIDVRYGNNTSISGNTMENMSLSGIFFGNFPGDTAEVYNVIISDNNITFSDTATIKQPGIDVNLNQRGSNIIVTNNVIENKHTSGYVGVNAHGIRVKAQNGASHIINNSIISNNIIRNAEDWGLYLERVKNTLISGNRIINSNSSASTDYDESIYADSIVSCTLSDNFMTTNSRDNMMYHVYLTSDCSNTTIKGNYMYPFLRTVVYTNGTTVHGDHISTTIGTIATGTLDERPIMMVGKAPNGILITGISLINASTVATDGTNYLTLQVRNKTIDGVGYFVDFTSGGTASLVRGDQITGATSGSTATVELVKTTSGTWAGGNAAGYILLSTRSAAFQSENLNVVGKQNNIATIPSDFNTPTPIFNFTGATTTLTAFKPTSMTIYAQPCEVMNDHVITIAKAEGGSGQLVDEMLVDIEYIEF